MTARERFIACAIEGVGGRYCTPPNEPHCTDCSGLVARCWHRATHRPFTGDSHQQFALGRVVSGALQPGDLLFFDAQGGREVRAGNRASHVGIYVGNGQMINALNRDAGVVYSLVDTDYWRPIRLGARRLFDDAGDPLPGLLGAPQEPPVRVGTPPPDPVTTSPDRPPRRDRARTRDRRRDRGRLLRRMIDTAQRRRVRR